MAGRDGFTRVFQEDECTPGTPGHVSVWSEFIDRYGIDLTEFRRAGAVETDHGDCFELLGSVRGRAGRVRVTQGPVCNEIEEEDVALPAAVPQEAEAPAGSGGVRLEWWRVLASEDIYRTNFAGSAADLWRESPSLWCLQKLDHDSEEITADTAEAAQAESEQRIRNWARDLTAALEEGRSE